jgi:hypothetical protein
LVELQIDPRLESMIRPKALGLHSIWNAILRIAFSIWFLRQDGTSSIGGFKRRTRGRLGTTREDFKTTQGSAGVPSSLGMLQVPLRAFGLQCSRTLGNYPSRPPRLLEAILLEYKVLGVYGHPWAHYSGGYQDRLLDGPLGLLDLCYTTPDGVERKDYGGRVLG